MNVLAVDLAAVFSGACQRTGVAGFPVDTRTWTSKNLSANQFISSLEECWAFSHLVLEDLPASLPNDTTLKRTYRIQGMIVDRVEQCVSWSHPLTVTWVKPAEWQRPMGVWKVGFWPTIEKAVQLGWVPPTKRTDKKSLSDMADAYLIALWSERMLAEELGLDLPYVEHVKFA